MTILINVINQELRLATPFKSIISGTQQFIKFKFTLDEIWKSVTPFAQFVQGGTAYNVYLDDENSCYLPTEIRAGQFTLMLYGSGRTKIGTTNYLTIKVTQNNYIGDAQSTEISQSLYDQLVDKVDDFINNFNDEEIKQQITDDVASELQRFLDEGYLANLTVEDGSLTRDKVNPAFEATLAKADNSWQKSLTGVAPMTEGSWEATYDPRGYGRGENPKDPYTYADDKGDDTIARMRGILPSAVSDGDQSFTITDTSEVEHEYTGIDSALQGVYGLNNAYANTAIQNALATYSPYTVQIVTEEQMAELLEGEGQARTFYLVDKNGSYDKYWYVSDGNGGYMWDKFGSSSTVVLNDFPNDPQEDVDYIIVVDDEYRYYKYINDAWVLIAGDGSSAEILGYDSENDRYYSYIFGDTAPSVESATPERYTNGVRYLKTDTFEYYTITENEGVYSWTYGGHLVETPKEKKEYFVKDDNGNWGHFKYIDGEFAQIGTSGYTKEQVDAMIQGLNSDISDVQSDVSEIQTTIDNFANMVVDVTINTAKDKLTITYMDGSSTEVELDKGTDIDNTAYDIDDDHTLHFYDSNGDELTDLAVVITGGGGGGTDVGGNVSIGRISPATVQTIYGDECQIDYTVTATDSSGEGVGDGIGTLFVNGVSVANGFTVFTSATGAENSVQVGEYLTVGANTIKISVSVDTGGETRKVATKTWTVNSVNMYLTWNYTDSQINTSAVTDYFTPYGALSKTIYTFIDVDPVGFNPEVVTELPNKSSPDFVEDDVIGVNYFVGSGNSYTHYVWDETTHNFVTAGGRVIDVTTTTRSGVQQAITIPMQSHGSHPVVRYMVGVINGETIKTAPQVHDMVFVVAGDSKPVIATSFNTGTMVQYNTVQIPIVVYDPSNPTTTVVLKENGEIASTWTGVDRTVHYWNYSPITFGEKILTITCGSTTKTIVIQVEELDIDEEEVTGYDFRFKASEMATNDSVREWSSTYTPVGSSASRTVDITFSPNFDWVNGGLHTETDENGHLRQYLAIRAGTTATFNYNLFGQDYDPKQYGKSFKFIFKAVNCRTYDGNVLTCMDTANGNNGVGLVMSANEATLTTANNSLKTYYYKDSYTEFEFNIHPNSEYRYLQFWMDGSPDITKLYDNSDGMQQVNPVGITVGSPNCDVYVYMLKVYPTYLTNDNELSNFIMDAPNAYEMVDRYNRNDVLNASGEVDYQKLASVCPDMRIVCLDLNRMSTGKKDNVVAYTARLIYNTGGESRSFTVQNACVTIQGTSSVGYLESAGNVDINFKNGRTFTSDNVSYTTGEVMFDDGTTSTKGYSINENSIPVDYLNVKVNVASSENCNNAMNADWYNTYQPWKSPAKKKNPKARDTMEFVAGAIFIRDRSGNLFGDTNNYHFYGICDIGNSKKNKKVFHDTSNPIAVCMEVSNNTSLPCLMSSLDYEWNADDDAVTQELVDGELKEQKVYEFRYVADDMEKVGEANWDRFVKFMVDWNPNLATNANLSSPVTFGTYTFKGSGSYDTSAYDSDDYKVVYLYGYGTPTQYNNGLYSASDYTTDTSGSGDCYYYINYSNDTIYSSNGSTWTALGQLTWTADRDNVLAGVNVGTYAGRYTKDTFEYRMAYMLQHCEEYMVIDPVIYHFVFIESFLMTDNVAKNTFWSTDDGAHWELSKDYDNDKMNVVIKLSLIYGENLEIGNA